MKELCFDLEEVVACFEELEDARSESSNLHPLTSVVATTVMAVLAGANGPTAIARWASLKKDLLLRVLDFPNGIPGKDVFRRVLAALKPDAFQACFVSWLQSLRDAAAVQERAANIPSIVRFAGRVRGGFCGQHERRSRRGRPHPAFLREWPNEGKPLRRFR